MTRPPRRARSCGCWPACRPRSTSFPSIPGRARRTNARTGRRSRRSPPFSTAPATPRRFARRAAATSWRPADSCAPRAPKPGRAPDGRPRRMSPEVQAFASGFPLMLLQAVLVLFAIACSAYGFLSPHKEIRRIREGDVAAAVSFAGVVFGLAIPLAAAMAAASSLLELALWASSVLVLALLAFRGVDLMLAGLPKRMREGEVSAAVVMTAGKLAVALILAAAVVV